MSPSSWGRIGWPRGGRRFGLCLRKGGWRIGAPEQAHQGVAVLELATFLPSLRQFQGISARVPNDEQSTGFKQGREDRIIQKLLGERGGSAAHVFLAVRRVGDDQVESASCGGQLGKRHEDILDPNLDAGCWQASGLEVGTIKPTMAFGFLNTDEFRGTPAQAFQTECTGPGKQIEHASSVDKLPQTVEYGQFHLIGGRSNGEAFGNLEQSIGGEAADDAHGLKIRWAGAYCRRFFWWKRWRRKGGREGGCSGGGANFATKDFPAVHRFP